MQMHFPQHLMITVRRHHYDGMFRKNTRKNLILPLIGFRPVARNLRNFFQNPFRRRGCKMPVERLAAVAVRTACAENDDSALPQTASPAVIPLTA